MATLTEHTDSSDADATQKAELAKPAPKGPPASRRPPNNSTAIGAGADGFFTIRKKGQGYWTRMGTAGGAALIGALTLQFIWGERDTFHMTPGVGEVVCALFLLVYAAGIYYFMNRPSSVDFLIATDSEMKKVNWTSRKELMGSTKVIILFMFVIAAFLFFTDLFFGYFFYLIGVLKTPPI